MELLDGRRSLEDIREQFVERFPARRPSLAHLQSLVYDLHSKGLVWSARPGQAEVLARRGRKRRASRLLSAAGNLLFIRVPGVDPSWLIRRLDPAARLLFHPLTVLLSALLVLGTWGWLVMEFDEFQRRLPPLDEILSWKTLLIAWITLGGAKVLHELSHALACRRFGRECHEIGLALLIFSPCLYCDVSDSWTLPSKWKRMAVAAAGMYVELLISAIALVLWWHARDGLASRVLLTVFLVTNVTTVAFNLNPLLRLDGYYILCDWLEIPNLRQKADRLLAATLARLCLRVRTAADPLLPRRGRAWFVAFAAASAAYRWVLVGMVTLILYQALKPWRLENLGLLLGGVSVTTALGGVVYRLGRHIRAKESGMRKSIRPWFSLAAAAALVAVALFVPLPWFVEAPLVVEPADVRHVFAATPGTVKAVHVQPGERVRRGQVLVELENPARRDRYEALASAGEVQKVEVAIHQATGGVAEETVAAENLRAIRAEADELGAQLARLRIVATCDGVVVAAPPVRRTARIVTRYASPAGTARRSTLPTPAATLRRASTC